MTNETNNGFLYAIMWLLTIGLSILSGIAAWNWIEPAGFFSAVLFIAAWGLLSRIAHFLAFGILWVVFNGKN